MGKHWKILGLSLLALVGVLAVNASAAQAKWLLLKNLASVKSTNVIYSSSEDLYFLSSNGAEIYCTGSTASGTNSLNEAETVLSGGATATFTGCEEQQFPETCGVHSTGQPNGTIVASGGGTVSMQSAEEITATATSPNFTTIEFSGEECPLNEAKEVFGGTVDVVILNALQDLKLHEVHIRGLNLKLGEAEAELHMIGESGPLPLILGTLEEATDATFAFHLCNLGGAACTLKG